MLVELKVMIPQYLVIFCDNVNVEYLANNLVIHSHTKNVEINLHFIKEKVQARALLVEYMPSESQIVYFMTSLLFSHYSHR